VQLSKETKILQISPLKETKLSYKDKVNSFSVQSLFWQQDFSKLIILCLPIKNPVLLMTNINILWSKSFHLEKTKIKGRKR
jgi:hypothetical protein